MRKRRELTNEFKLEAVKLAERGEVDELTREGVPSSE